MNPLNVNLFVKLQDLARILGNAAMDGGYVDRGKVEEILRRPNSVESFCDQLDTSPTIGRYLYGNTSTNNYLDQELLG